GGELFVPLPPTHNCAKSLSGQLPVVGKKAGLQAIFAVVDTANSVVDIAVTEEVDKGAKGFLAGDTHTLIHACQHGGLQEIAFSLATGEQFSAARFGLIEPRPQPVR